MAVSDRIAVMEAGTIVQTGTAEDLYHRPSSRFVAQFIGRANLVEARIESIDSNGVAVTALAHRFVLRERPDGVAAGDTVRLLLRPEAIGLTRPSAIPHELTAEVVSRAFLGEKIEYLLRCADETLQVARYNAGASDLFHEGEAVALRFVEEAMIILKEDGRAGAG